MEDGGRRDDGLEGVEAVVILVAAGERGGGADAGKVEVTGGFAVERIDGESAVDVVEAEDEELVVYGVDGLEDVRSLRDDGLPGVGVGAEFGFEDACDWGRASRCRCKGRRLRRGG